MTKLSKLQLALCLKEKECPENFPGNHPQSCICHGTDKVPLLEGVREKCPNTVVAPPRGWHHPVNKGVATFEAWVCGENCPKCRGRGWMPSQDPLKYAEVLFRLWEHDVRRDQELLEIGFGVFKGNLLSNIAKALGVKDA